MQRLPIDDVMPQVRDALASHANLVLVAPPGAGKTTRVPPWLVRTSGFVPADQGVVLLQPRRLAARACAGRIAEEWGCRLGDEVGYQIRFENRTNARTRLRVVTEGILARRLRSDPSLEGVHTVVFDEFHERNLHSDVALSLLRELQQSLRPDLRIIVMSATLEAEPVAKFLGDCPIVVSEGRSFPVDVRYQSRSAIWNDVRGLGRDVAEAVGALLTEPGDDRGHVLVFLPGMGEIRRAESDLAGFASARGCEIHALHGSLPSELQDRVLKPSARRKIILSTNVAETSITIDGVSAVVDAGLARVARSDPRFGLDRLELARISEASATQRAGRAGRQSPGRCVRLWSSHEQSQLKPSDVPEIRRMDLSATLLLLADWGVRDPLGFDWFETPPAPQVEAALTLLRELGAIAADGSITESGRRLLEIPATPRWARVLDAAASTGDAGLLQQAARAVAMLAERDLMPRGASTRRGDSDLDVRFELLDARLRDGTGRALASAIEQYERAARGAPLSSRDGSPRNNESRAPRTLAEILLLAFPDRLCRRRAPGDRRAVMAGGRGVVLDESSCVHDAELFLALDAEESRRDGKLEARVSIAVAVERASLERLFPERLKVELEARYDSDKERVVAERALRFGSLALEDPKPAILSPEDASALLGEALAHEPRSFLATVPSAVSWLERYEMLRTALPEEELPEFDDTKLATAVRDGVTGCRRLDAARELDWPYLLSLVVGGNRVARLVDTEAPESWLVPSGQRSKLRYEAEGRVFLSVRLQELFGAKSTPKIARGRVAVVLELLGPNYRPVQVTQDLESFWARGYPEIRKELRARYPRHSWPDDPLTAKPEAKGGRRRS